MMEDSTAISKLTDLRAQDVCILPDPGSKTYTMIASGFGGVRAWTSKDLVNWQGPKAIFRTPPDIWGDLRTAGIWAPEMHFYQGKYYLFLTFNSQNKLPEQWRDWRPRVTRGSQVLVGDSPNGPFKAFHNHATTPADMMTLDGTLWVEDGVPYLVFAHEWGQIVNGSIEAIPLKDNGGHGMTFKTFEGKLMMVLHAPDQQNPRPRLFEREDTGETLRIVREFTGGEP